MEKSIWTVSIVLFVSVFGCTGLAGKNGSSASKTVAGPVLRLDSKTIDLGVIPAGEDTIVGTIPIMNDGDGFKDDIVPIWRDNGSFNALDNDDFD